MPQKRYRRKRLADESPPPLPRGADLKLVQFLVYVSSEPFSVMVNVVLSSARL